MNNNISDFFEQANKDLDFIIKDELDPDVQECFDNWKNKVVSKLDGAYKVKIKRLNIFFILEYECSTLAIDGHKLDMLKTILRDMYFKYNQKNKSKSNVEIKKLLKAREENIDFELELAKMITGDNDKFPYRSSKYLTEFFYSLGYDFTHSGETRTDWVKERLEELHIKDIHDLLINGLFKKKYFTDYVEKNNLEAQHELEEIDIDYFLKNAKAEFEKFIKKSITINEVFDLSTVLDMSVNIELLFDNKVNTSDNELNKLIEEAKERFLSNDKQVGLEKLWDAYERLKTYFSKNKKVSSEKIVNIITVNFDEKFINDEFKTLTNIGNSYRIRHHEVDKKELTSKHINYFFFRMMSLIDLCLLFLNEAEEN